jgi:hypothetical protein
VPGGPRYPTELQLWILIWDFWFVSFTRIFIIVLMAWCLAAPGLLQSHNWILIWDFCFVSFTRIYGTCSVTEAAHSVFHTRGFFPDTQENFIQRVLCGTIFSKKYCFGHVTTMRPTLICFGEVCICIVEISVEHKLCHMYLSSFVKYWAIVMKKSLVYSSANLALRATYVRNWSKIDPKRRLDARCTYVARTFFQDAARTHVKILRNWSANFPKVARTCKVEIDLDAGLACVVRRLSVRMAQVARRAIFPLLAWSGQSLERQRPACCVRATCVHPAWSLRSRQVGRICLRWTCEERKVSTSASDTKG